MTWGRKRVTPLCMLGRGACAGMCGERARVRHRPPPLTWGPPCQSGARRLAPLSQQGAGEVFVTEVALECPCVTGRHQRRTRMGGRVVSAIEESLNITDSVPGASRTAQYAGHRDDEDARGRTSQSVGGRGSEGKAQPGFFGGVRGKGTAEPGRSSGLAGLSAPAAAGHRGWLPPVLALGAGRQWLGVEGWTGQWPGVWARGRCGRLWPPAWPCDSRGRATADAGSGARSGAGLRFRAVTVTFRGSVCAPEPPCLTCGSPASVANRAHHVCVLMQGQEGVAPRFPRAAVHTARPSRETIQLLGLWAHAEDRGTARAGTEALHVSRGPPRRWWDVAWALEPVLAGSGTSVMPSLYVAASL